MLAALLASWAAMAAVLGASGLRARLPAWFTPEGLRALAGPLRRVPASERPDALGTALLAACSERGAPREGEPSEWLAGIGRRTAAQWGCRARACPEIGLDLPDMPDHRPDPEAGAIVREAEQARIEGALILVQRAEREHPIGALFVLWHDIDGRPLPEIAAEQGIPESTAYRLRRRAIEAMARAPELHPARAAWIAARDSIRGEG